MGAGRLTGRRVVVTRPRERAGPLVSALEAEGAEVILLPMIEVVPPEDPAPLEAAAARLGDWDWVVFTSVYAVHALRGAAAEPPDPDQGRPRWACVGHATAGAARAAGWAAELVPPRASAEALVSAMRERTSLEGTRVLFPRASDAQRELPAALRAAGAVVDEVVAYRKVPPRGAPGGVAAALRGGDADALTFTSPSTVRNFLRSFGVPAPGVRVVVIGRTTARAAEAAGVRVTAVAETATVAGLVDGVVRAFNG